MRLEIDFNDEIGEVKEEECTLVQQLLFIAAEQEGVKEGTEVSITFVDNDRIQEINREYRDKDQPTDVISFALEEMGEGEIVIISEDIPKLLGDIIISIPKAREQAKDYGHSFARELGFLAVHGFLHLLGYDHMTQEDEEKMFSRQKEILEAYGLER